MTIFMPSPLRPFTGGEGAVEVDAATVGEALDLLTRLHPDLRNRLFNDEGQLRPFVNLYLNSDDVRHLPRKEATPVQPSDTLAIIPVVPEGLELSSPPGADRRS